MMGSGYVPEHTHEALMNYFNHCYEPGSFLMAVLRNDLMAASMRADHVNREHLASIAAWVCHNAPYGSWGSEEAIRGWLRKNEHQQAYEKKLVMKILSTE
jgi:hypothetical protein